MSGTPGRHGPDHDPGIQTCACNCRQCSLGYHCSPCAKRHIAAMKQRHPDAYLKKLNAPTFSSGGIVARPEDGSDSVPVMLLPGEVYFTREQVKGD